MCKKYLIGTIVWIAIASPAYAWDLEFTFDNGPVVSEYDYSNGHLDGTVTGIVRNINEDGTIPSEKNVFVDIVQAPELTDASRLTSAGYFGGSITVLDGVLKEVSLGGELYANNRGYDLRLNSNYYDAKGLNWLYDHWPTQGYMTGNARGFAGARYRLLPSAHVTPAVPEPASWALMILGFGVVGYALRRRHVRYGGAQLA